MQKLYVVRLTDQEREELRSVVKKLKGTGQKVRSCPISVAAYKATLCIALTPYTWVGDPLFAGPDVIG